jgi:hypothetical protein
MVRRDGSSFSFGVVQNRIRATSDALSGIQSLTPSFTVGSFAAQFEPYSAGLSGWGQSRPLLN